MWQKNKDTHAYIANIKQLSISGALMSHPSPETWVGGTSASVDHRTYIGQLSDNKCYRDLGASETDVQPDAFSRSGKKQLCLNFHTT